MTIESMALVMHHSRAHGIARMVLMGIANHAGEGGAWVGLRKLGTYANTHPRNVRKHLRTLEDLGEITTYLQAGGWSDMADHERPNRYKVNVTCPPWCDRSGEHRDLREMRGSSLWKNPRAETPPPGDNALPPRAETPGPPRAITPPKPYLEPGATHLPATTTDRARAFAAQARAALQAGGDPA